MLSLLLPAMLAAAAQAPASPTPAVQAAPAAPAEELLRDTRGRPVIRTWIDGRGPVEMIVDTAAQTSLIVADAAARIGLTPADETINVAGATGDATSMVYRAKRFSTKLFALSDVALVGLPNAGTTNAQGIVGIDAFRSRRLLFDRTNARLTSEPSGPLAAGFVAVKGRLDGNGFVQVPMTLNGVTVDALVDTGAAVTIVNAAAFRQLGWAAGDPRLKAGGEIRGASAGGETVRIATLDRVVIGPVKLSNVPLIVSGDAGDDMPPAIILGGDLLNLLDAFTLDFSRAELQIKLPTK